jgi:hypothetical protein
MVMSTHRINGNTEVMGRGISGTGVGLAAVDRRPMKRWLGILLLSLLAIAAIGAQKASAAGAAQGTTEITCDHITWTYTGFPNAANNVVTQIISINGVKGPEETVTFNGPEFTDTTPINPPPQSDKIDARAKWNTNGVKGGFDHIRQLHCEKPSFTIEKKQLIVGEGKPFSTEEQVGLIGETVDYEILVTNTGNVPLTFSNFTDTHCDAGTIEGGPGAAPVAPGETTTYTCSHVLTEAGKYINYAYDTGTPPAGQGEPKIQKSNTVVVRSLSKPAYATCTSVTFLYRGFPNATNTVTQIISIDGVKVFENEFTFNGPSGMDTIEITIPAGKHKVDARAKWNTNGFKSGYDVETQLNCP